MLDKLKRYKIFYDKEKREKTIKKHGLDLEKIKQKLEGLEIVKCFQHTKKEYKDQVMIILLYDDYPVCCPVKVDDTKREIKIITAFKNRKFKSLIKKKGK